VLPRKAEFDVDLFVVGGGSGVKVVLAEEYRLGGACVIRGCVPKKLFVYARRFLGIHILAEEASEVVQVLAIAVGSGATMKDFMSVTAVHPMVGKEIVAMQTPTVRYDPRDASTPPVPSAAV
jgi:pyruvate/2-oxoglutarate dehydrogenase complex dihydrolipoamide dehydrogenase (E3) component